MAENTEKKSGPTRKQALAISSGILLIAVAVAGFIIWQATPNETDLNEPSNDSEDAEVSIIDVREEPLLFAPDPYESSQEELDNYENFLKANIQDTDTLFIEEGCLVEPVVAGIIDPRYMRIANNTDRERTLEFMDKEFNVAAEGEEFINILSVTGEGRHYYICDDILTGIIIVEEN